MVFRVDRLDLDSEALLGKEFQMGDTSVRFDDEQLVLVDPDEEVQVPAVGGRKPQVISRQILSEIIEPRAEELFTLVGEAIDEFKTFSAQTGRWKSFLLRNRASLMRENDVG